MQQETRKWFRCGESSAPAWSQDGGLGENHKLKIDAARAQTCPAQIKDGQGLSTQQSTVRRDEGLGQANEDM